MLSLFLKKGLAFFDDNDDLGADDNHDDDVGNNDNNDDDNDIGSSNDVNNDSQRPVTCVTFEPSIGF
jgi:hypothetical protein